MSRVVFVVALATLAAAIAGWQYVEQDGREEYLPGDCPFYAATAESLLRDGDFDLGNQLAPGLTGGERADALRKHDSYFALGPDGRVVPKHSVLLPILSLPFRAALGRPGFLVFNVVQVCLLVYSLSLLAGDTRTARLLALVAYAWSPLSYYTYNFSPDVLGALLATRVYLAAVRGHWVWCGLLAGLAVWAKVYLAAVVLPAGLLVAVGGWRAVLYAAVAGAAGLAPFLILNVHLYGGPLATGYDRTSDVQPDGTVRTVTHYTRFNQPVLTGLNNILFDHELGAVPTAPLWALWPVGVWFLWRSGQWRLALALTGGVAINLLIFARYDEWAASINGNRFLFPAFVLGFAAQGPLWEAGRARLWRGLFGGPRHAQDQSANAPTPM